MVEQLKIPVCIFALIMVGMLGVFLASIPVRVLTPQIARLEYYACQNGLYGGPLSSSLRELDWRKSFIWRASDTEYRQRQFTQFFELLAARAYTHLYCHFSPFMWLPLSLLMVFIIGFLIALVVRQWTGGWGGGVVAGSFWLMTSGDRIIFHPGRTRSLAAEVLPELLLSPFVYYEEAEESQLFPGAGRPGPRRPLHPLSFVLSISLIR